MRLNMSKQAKQTKINISHGILQTEESTFLDNSLLHQTNRDRKITHD